MTDLNSILSGSGGGDSPGKPTPRSPRRFSFREREQSVVPTDVEEADARARVEPPMGVVDVCEGLLKLALVAEVFRVLAIRARHRKKVLCDLVEVRPRGSGNLSLREGALRQGDVLFYEGSEVHTLAPRASPRCNLNRYPRVP